MRFEEAYEGWIAGRVLRAGDSKRAGHRPCQNNLSKIAAVLRGLMPICNGWQAFLLYARWHFAVIWAATANNALFL